MRDMRAVGVSFLTLGQYLQPTLKHLAVERFVTPEFEDFKKIGEEMGFLYVASSPLVRVLNSRVFIEKDSTECMTERLRLDQFAGFLGHHATARRVYQPRPTANNARR